MKILQYFEVGCTDSLKVGKRGRIMRRASLNKPFSVYNVDIVRDETMHRKIRLNIK